MLLRTLFLVALLQTPALFAAAAEPGVEFSGAIDMDGKVRVHLKNTSSGVANWIPVGETFAGYVITSFDAKTNTVSLTKNGVTLQLGLQGSRIATTATAATPAPAPAAATPVPAATQTTVERAVTNNLRQISAAADQYFLENGVNRATMADLIGPDKYIKALNPVAGEDYSKLELAHGKDLIVTLPTGGTVTWKQ